MKNEKDLTNLFRDINLRIGENSTLQYTINRGGCGWFSFYLSNTLKQYGVKTKIARLEDSGTYNWWKNGFKIIKEAKENLNNDHITASHFMVKIGHIFVDGNSTINLKKSTKNFNAFELESLLGWKKVNGYYSIKDMKLALKLGVWNYAYNTSNNKIVKKIIETECCNFFQNNSYLIKKAA
jgi:hypothetical protein